jgi:transcriptional regulator with XRE-family HTH domain
METLDITAIGKRIRQIRGKMTLPEFAKHFNMHGQTLSCYEKGYNAPDALFFKKICEDFNIEARWLLLGEGPMRPGDHPGKSGIEEDAASHSGDKLKKDGFPVTTSRSTWAAAPWWRVSRSSSTWPLKLSG